MLLTNWLNCLTNHRRPQRSGRGRRQAKPASAALRVERLEDRTLLTTAAVVEFVNGIVQVTGNDDPVSADADDHLEIDVRFDNATPTNDGAGFYLHVLATDGGAGGTVTAVGDFVNQIDTDEVTVFIGAKLDPDPPANNPNKILKEKTRGVRVEGLNGDDVIDADPGGSGTNWMKVTLLGGDGDDVLTGSAAKSRLLGEDGDDWLVGGISNDRLMGGPGDDWLTGREGDDTLVGGAGADTLDGGSFFTSLFDDGDDSLLGGGGNDLLSAGTSNVDTNSNTVNGGAGRDTLVAVDFNPVIDLDPGPGEDLRVVPHHHHPRLESRHSRRAAHSGQRLDDVVHGGPRRGMAHAYVFRRGRDGPSFSAVTAPTTLTSSTSMKSVPPPSSASAATTRSRPAPGLIHSWVARVTTSSTPWAATTPFNGDAGDDKLFGGDGPRYVLQGGLGFYDDTLYGQGGDDTLYAAMHDGVESTFDVDGVADSLLFKTSPDRIFPSPGPRH